MPGMYAVTSSPLVRRTRATLRSAEFGFLGVTVLTCVHTPRRCGLPVTSKVRVGRSGWPGLGPVRITRNARVLTFCSVFSRPRRTSWFMVGKALLHGLGKASIQKQRPHPQVGPRLNYTKGPFWRQMLHEKAPLARLG